MEDLCDLLFELSSTERLKMLFNIKERRLRLSQISQKQEITVTEASRHLQRLTDSRLIQKDSEGTYGLTSFGDIILNLLPGIDFISKNREYFVEHDMMQIPKEFIGRVRELSNSILDRDTVRVFGYAERTLKEAEEYIWIQSYQVLIWTTPVISEKVKKGVEFRFIYPKDIVPPPNYEPTNTLYGADRVAEKLGCRIVVTEKEAQLSFPFKNGNIDYAAFISKDESFRNWCRDLFLYNWERANSQT